MKACKNHPLTAPILWRRLSLGVGLLVISLAALPALAQGRKNPSPATQSGRKIFEGNCSFCHGADATGGRGPDLVRSRLVADDVKGNLIGQVVLNGRPRKGMPAFHLSSAQIADISAFLHYRQLQDSHSGRVPRNYALKYLLTGNAAAGKSYFNGAGGCANCHSPAGDLAHVASRFLPLELELKMLYPGNARRTVTVTLPSGKQVHGSLLHLDEFNVALRDASGWYRSFPRSGVKVAVHDPLAAHRKLLGQLTQADVHNLFAYLETLK